MDGSAAVLGPGDSYQVTFTTTLDPAVQLVYSNSATATGDDPVGATISDVSDDGSDTASNPTENVGSPTSLTLPAPIDAMDDAPAAVEGATGATIPNVVANDTLNGVADPNVGPGGTVSISTGATAQDGRPLGVPATDQPASGSITLDPNTGEIVVAAGTTVGTYTYSYEICETLYPTNCDTAEVTVVVGNPPVASNDTVAAAQPGPVTIDPLVNDDGANLLDPTSVTLTGTGAPSGSVLSADGKTLSGSSEGEWSVDPTTGLVTFTPVAGFFGSPTPAAYTVADVLGQISNEANLSVTILAAIGITAYDDGPVALDGSNGGASMVSVLNNDTLGGNPIIDPTLVTLTTVTAPSPVSGSITLNLDGTVTTAPETTPGTYTLVYEICETANPTNCATAEVELIIVDTGAGILNEIEEDLKDILKEDLANTLTVQSNQISGYSADALTRLRSRGGNGECLAAVNLQAKHIHFDVDKATIKPESHNRLDSIAQILIGCSGFAFEIAGHTDSDASHAYNTDLSKRRVLAVRQALSQRGVNISGYIARGYGESQPIASNATEQDKARNRRVEFRQLGQEKLSVDGPCEDSFSLLRTFNADANAISTRGDGQYRRDQHDCRMDRREVFEGSLSYIDTDQGQKQSSINLSFRREQYQGDESVFGYFVGLYGSWSDVTRLADGEVSGLGLNAGIYGATRLNSPLFFDSYLGVATGRHEFNLAFDQSIGTIDTTGNYNYLAAFTGAAFSGEVQFGETALTPRVGFDYVYTPKADVDVIAELGGLSEVGDLELDVISGGRAFVELRFDHLLADNNTNFWFNPRGACYRSLGSLNSTCGFGGSVGLESTKSENGLSYAVKIDGEKGGEYTFGTLTLRAERELKGGTVSGHAQMSSQGSATLGGQYETEF